MNDTIASTDLTERATAGGWVLPDGWTVRAEIWRDDMVTDPAEEFDCYSERQVEAWRRDDWMFVGISVYVVDAAGRTWGWAVHGGTEYGSVPGFEDDAPTYDVDPLEDTPGEYSPIREYDMIGEALRDAVKELAEFGDPHGLIREPAGDMVTGL